MYILSIIAYLLQYEFRGGRFDELSGGPLPRGPPTVPVKQGYPIYYYSPVLAL